MTQNSLLVIKFGGAAVENLEQFSQVASIIEARLKEFQAIVVVVSAMRGMTDHLINLAHAVNPHPPRREYDMLVSVGERISCSLLAMALANLGISSASFTGSQAGIITSEEHTDAQILEVRPYRLFPYLQAGQVAVVAGFQGVSRSGSITTLGRGGTDTSAVALAVALGAQCVEFYKDVPGIFSADPKTCSSASPIPCLTYYQALELIQKTGKVLHPRCIQLAANNGILLKILSFHNWKNSNPQQTTIYEEKELPTQPIYEELSLVS